MNEGVFSFEKGDEVGQRGESAGPDFSELPGDFVFGAWDPTLRYQTSGCYQCRDFSGNNVILFKSLKASKINKLLKMHNHLFFNNHQEGTIFNLIIMFYI